MKYANKGRKRTKYTLLLITLLIAVLSLLTYNIYAFNKTIEELEIKVALNEQKITHINNTKEQLHILANSYRNEYIRDDEFVQLLGGKWEELNEKSISLKNSNNEIADKIRDIRNKYIYIGNFELTAYCYGNRTATGTIPTANKTIAVDPKIIPYGTRVYIDGYGTYIAEDCGGAVKGNVIDIYIPDFASCISFGRRRADVYLINE